MTTNNIDFFANALGGLIGSSLIIFLIYILIKKIFNSWDIPKPKILAATFSVLICTLIYAYSTSNGNDPNFKQSFFNYLAGGLFVLFIDSIKSKTKLTRFKKYLSYLVFFCIALIIHIIIIESSGIYSNSSNINTDQIINKVLSTNKTDITANEQEFLVNDTQKNFDSTMHRLETAEIKDKNLSKVLKVITKTITDSHKDSEGIQDQIILFFSSDFMSIDTNKSKEELITRISKLNQVIDDTKKLGQAFETLPSLLKQNLTNANLSAKSVGNTLTGFNRTYTPKLNAFRNYNQSMKKTLNHIKNFLLFCYQHFDVMSCNIEYCEFEDDSLIKKYNGLNKKFIDSFETTIDLENKYLILENHLSKKGSKTIDKLLDLANQN